MSFEIIEYPEPIVEPAKAEKQYPIGWLETFSAKVVSASEGTAYYEVRAMALDGEKHPSRTHEVRIENIWAAAQAVPEIGIAVAAIVSAVKAYDEWLATQE